MAKSPALPPQSSRVKTNVNFIHFCDKRFSEKKGEKVLSLAQRTSLQLHEIHECFRAKNKDKLILQCKFGIYI